LAEINRARAICGHASQFADAQVDKVFWDTWDRFEVAQGNGNTFKEMLRVRRSVAAKFNTDVNFIASQAIARSQAAPAGLGQTNGDHQEGAGGKLGNAIVALER
jgi:pre-mRNA-splicing factor SYF1